MSRNIISYSLWGNSSLYIEGMIKNVELAKILYPTWTVLIYVAENCPAIPILKEMECELRIMPSSEGVDRENKEWKKHPSHINMFWRYYILDELEEGDVVLFRDADSYLSEREIEPVKKWLSSNKICMRFIENEAQLISFFMGGMWGIKGGVLKGIEESIKEWIELFETFNHDGIFIDLCYHNYVLSHQLKSSIMTFGYKQEFPLPELKDGKYPIGYVQKGHLRNIEFNEKKFRLERMLNV